MANDAQPGESSRQDDSSNVNKEMEEALKKLQTDMEVLRSENETLKKDLTTARSRSKTVTKKSIYSVVRRLDMDGGYNVDPNEEDKRRYILDVDDGKQTHDEEEYEKPTNPDKIAEKNRERDKRRSKHRRSRSNDYIPESVRKELQEVRALIQRIPGVPKPLEKAKPYSYADSPFTADIAMVDIPKRFTVPHMKPYDGSLDPL